MTSRFQKHDPRGKPSPVPIILECVFTKFSHPVISFFLPNAKSVHCPPLPRSSHSLLLAERLGLRVEGPVTDVEEEEADGEDDARVLVDDVDVLDAGQRLLHHARPAFELKQREMSAMK